MPLKLDPFLRLLKLLGKPRRFANVGQAVERSFAKSMKGAQLKKAIARKVARSPAGTKGVSDFKVKGDQRLARRIIRAARGGEVTSRWNYRRSLGHLTEDAASRSGRFRKVLFTNPGKDTNRPGLDLGYLSVDRKGRFGIAAADVKAQQAQGRISRVSAQGKNLAKNLGDERLKALAASRDKARPYGERVMYRAVSMTINKVLKSNPKSQARSISAAIKQGTLRLEVRNDGGNATGLGKRLAQRMKFDDRRLFEKDANGNPTRPKVNTFRHGLLPNEIRRRYRLSGNTIVQRFPSREAELSRRRGTPSEYRLTSGQGAIERFRSRLAEGKHKLAKPARPVATRTSAKTATGQQPPKQVGSRDATKGGAKAPGNAKPVGTRSARPSGGSSGMSRTKGGATGAGGSKAPQPGPAYRPFGRPYGQG